MNKMTILFFVFFVALLSFGARVYAQEKKDTVKVEQSVNDKDINQDSLLRAQVDSLQAPVDTMNASFKEMQQDKKIFSFLTVKNAFIILLCLTLIILLIQILAFVKLANKVSKLDTAYDRLKHKIEKVKDDVKWENVQSSNKRQDDRHYHPTQQRKDPYADQNPPVSHNEKELSKKDEQKQQEKKQRIEKSVFCKNNEGEIFVPPFSNTKDDATTFVIEYDPEQKTPTGTLSYIGNIKKFTGMNQESRNKAFKIEYKDCTLADARVVEMSKPGQVIFNNDYWSIVIPVKVILKK